MTTDAADRSTWLAARVRWADEPDRRRILAAIADRLEPGRWFSAELPDDETEVAWKRAGGDAPPGPLAGVDLVEAGAAPRLLDPRLNGFEAPAAYPRLLALTTVRAVQVLTAAGARGRPDAAAEVATVWRSLVPDPPTRAHVLGQGSAWLERRATAAASEVAGGSSRRAAGRSWTYDAGSGEPRTPDPDLTAVGAELRASCDAGPFVQLCCRAVHVHKVRLLPLAGHEDVAAELRAEASLWRAIADA